MAIENVKTAFTMLYSLLYSLCYIQYYILNVIFSMLYSVFLFDWQLYCFYWQEIYPLFHSTKSQTRCSALLLFCCSGLWWWCISMINCLMSLSKTFKVIEFLLFHNRLLRMINFVFLIVSHEISCIYCYAIFKEKNWIL